MGVVKFNVASFRAAYPQFEKFSDVQLENFFSYAEIILDNSASSHVTDEAERERLLWLLVCHLATLDGRGAAVGSITSASEGSVSTSFSSIDLGNGRWYGQTTCGVLFWEATKKYRQGGRQYVFRACHR